MPVYFMLKLRVLETQVMPSFRVYYFRSAVQQKFVKNIYPLRALKISSKTTGARFPAWLVRQNVVVPV